QRGEARERADLVLRHLPERAPVASQAATENAEVLHCSAEYHAEEYPESAREIPELRRQDRTDERPGAGDGREVMPEHHPAVGGDEIAAIVQALRRGRSRGVEREDARRDEGAVEPVRERVAGDGGDDEPDRVHRLTAHERKDRDRRGADECHQQPSDGAQGVVHTARRRRQRRSGTQGEWGSRTAPVRAPQTSRGRATSVPAPTTRFPRNAIRLSGGPVGSRPRTPATAGNPSPTTAPYATATSTQTSHAAARGDSVTWSRAAPTAISMIPPPIRAWCARRHA